MIIVYTCNIGHYDLYRNIFPKDNKVNYIYFTDDGVPVSGWKVLPVDTNIINSPRKLARYYKINSHLVLPEHDVSLWLDARFIIKEDAVEKFVKQYRKNDISCFYYPYDKRHCAYDEAEACLESRLNGKHLIHKQVAKYKSEGFPEQYGLYATGIMIRRNNEDVKRFNEVWWNEVRDFSERDQISQCYASWKTGVSITAINSDRNVYNNEIVKVYKHRVKRRDQYKAERNELIL